MSSAVPEKRDVKEPLLFECAWEVANKGSRQVASLSRQNFTEVWLDYSTVMIAHNSWRNLHGHQDQGAGHCLRVWRPVLLDRAVELQDRTDGGRSAGA